MALHQRISRAGLARKIGRCLPVLVDERNDGEVVGRSTADAPDIDGVVRIDAAPNAMPGDFIKVEITGADDYDLRGRLLN